jgi:hypothetical protein
VMAQLQIVVHTYDMNLSADRRLLFLLDQPLSMTGAVFHVHNSP